MNDFKVEDNPFVAKKIDSPNRFFRRAFMISSIIVIVCSLGVICATGFWLDELGVFDIEKDDLSAITNWKSPDNTLVFDKNGKKIGEFFSSHHIYVPYDKIPKSIVQSIVAIEDRNFWDHPGIDFKAIIRAGVAYFRNNGRYTQGASTITQQVVRHFLLTNEKTIIRKIKEIAFAIALEKNTTKEKIFEIYANALYLGSGSYGVGSAAYRYFGKPINKIKLHEAAVIAGLFQLPSRYNPHKNPKLAKSRQKLVLKRMVKTKVLSKRKERIIRKRKLRYKKYRPIYGSKSPYFVDHVREQISKVMKDNNSIKNQGLRIYTTLDPVIQKHAERAMAQNESLIKETENRTLPMRQQDGGWANRRVEAAIVVTSSRSGKILAMVGGRDYKISKFNRTTKSMRSPGSAFKPIVYSEALERGKRWSDMIYVSPVTVDGNYRPRNSNVDYMTETTLQRAFYRSMNSPTIVLSKQVGVSRIIEQAKNLGITSPIKNEFGTSLGSSEVNMLEMAKVYSTFANLGVRIKQSSITRITDREGKILYELPPLEERSEKAISPQIAYLMTQAMRSVLRHGTAYSAAELSKWAAGKTGTSNQSKDNWFCGYTSDLTAIVWGGTDDFTGLSGNVRGSTLALPIWKNFMKAAISTKEPDDFARPPGVVSALVHPKYGHQSRAGIKMWFTDHNLPEKGTSALEALRIGGNYRNIFSQ